MGLPNYDRYVFPSDWENIVAPIAIATFADLAKKKNSNSYYADGVKEAKKARKKRKKRKK